MRFATVFCREMRATASDSQPPLLLPFFPESASRNPSSDPTSSPSSFPPSPLILSRKRVHNNHRRTVAVATHGDIEVGGRLCRTSTKKEKELKKEWPKKRKRETDIYRGEILTQ
ncbi:hypothetical protein CDAR_610041 [Caerostris darwini]|uniref:Uncharacterized protein n=1 Tax=Caerostris darwini TaxID=1538125 RepID=A0AAV4RYA1_9ARAC|nr:hypothetical protein CDAR_610041 [Caerostris darwini]